MDWLNDPQAWASLLTLTVLEIVLGIDNLIFITILAGRLPAQPARARAASATRERCMTDLRRGTRAPVVPRGTPRVSAIQNAYPASASALVLPHSDNGGRLRGGLGPACGVARADAGCLGRTRAA